MFLLHKIISREYCDAFVTFSLLHVVRNINGKYKLFRIEYFLYSLSYDLLYSFDS